jgi:predicted GNAT family N-acyltransferase
MSEIDIQVIGTQSALEAAFAIRRAVFCREQGVPEALEIDGRDGQCTHYLVRLAGAPIGTARTRTIAPGTAKIERVAVLAEHRGRGVGKSLMQRILADLDVGGLESGILHAQAVTERFYAALGFSAEGDRFDEAGIAHIKMVRKFPKTPRN